MNRDELIAKLLTEVHGWIVRPGLFFVDLMWDVSAPDVDESQRYVWCERSTDRVVFRCANELRMFWGLGRDSSGIGYRTHGTAVVRDLEAVFPWMRAPLISAEPPGQTYRS
jgi:hypothetical protein